MKKERKKERKTDSRQDMQHNDRKSTKIQHTIKTVRQTNKQRDLTKTQN